MIKIPLLTWKPSQIIDYVILLHYSFSLLPSVFSYQDFIHDFWVHENSPLKSKNSGSSDLTSCFFRMVECESCRGLVQRLNSSLLGKRLCQRRKGPTLWLTFNWRLNCYSKTSSINSKLCSLWNKKTMD